MVGGHSDRTLRVDHLRYGGRGGGCREEVNSHVKMLTDDSPKDHLNFFLVLYCLRQGEQLPCVMSTIILSLIQVDSE